MGDKSKIEWTDATWNCITGCTKVSPGCDHCYAERITERFHGKGSFADVVLHPERLDVPLRWRKPRRVFVNSMSDLFHDDVPAEFIARMFAVMATTPQHTYQILTKRHARLRSLLSDDAFRRGVYELAWNTDREGRFDPYRYTDDDMVPAHYTRPASCRDDDSDWWPLRNVWLGVSVEDQKWADIRIPALLSTPAAVRFLSCEPLLGPVDLSGPAEASGHRPRLTYWLTGRPGWGSPEVTGTGLVTEPLEIGPRVDWVIAGGESGPGARPMLPDWARSLRDQCQAAAVPFFFKQFGEWAPTGALGIGGHDPRRGFVGGPKDEHGCREEIARVGKHAAGRVLDGRTWDEYPREPATVAG